MPTCLPAWLAYFPALPSHLAQAGHHAALALEVQRVCLPGALLPFQQAQQEGLSQGVELGSDDLAPAAWGG